MFDVTIVASDSDSDAEDGTVVDELLLLRKNGDDIVDTTFLFLLRVLLGIAWLRSDNIANALVRHKCDCEEDDEEDDGATSPPPRRSTCP